MTQENCPASHTLTLSDKKLLSVTGVSQITGFADTAVAMDTALGALTVHGQGLKLKKLTPEDGLVRIEGQIYAIVYRQSVSRRRHRL